MHSNTKLGNNDNGAVFTAKEAVLSGAASDRPQDICTKYPEACTELQVAEDDCGTRCCNTVKPKVDDCKERLLYSLTVVNDDVGNHGEYNIRLSNISNIAITNIRVNIVSSVTHHIQPVISNGSIVVIGPGTREWVWTIDSLAPHSEVYIKLKSSYTGYALCLVSKADAPAELTEDSILYCKNAI